MGDCTPARHDRNRDARWPTSGRRSFAPDPGVHNGFWVVGTPHARLCAIATGTARSHLDSCGWKTRRLRRKELSPSRWAALLECKSPRRSLHQPGRYATSAF